MNSEGTLQRIQTRLRQPVAPVQVIEELLPRTRTEAITWAQRLAAWDEYRGQYPGQVVALARVVSLRAMRTFGFTLSEDGRVVSRLREGKRWQTPTPSLSFRLEVQGEEVRVEYTPDYFPNGGKDHFYFVSPHEPPRPHCLSGTGYLSQFAPHDAVEACGGARDYAALFAEARLRGEEQAFKATFEGVRQDVEQPRRKNAPSRGSPAAAGEGHPPVLGDHTAQVIGEQEGTEDRHDPPHQGMLF
jgi:hypothetical protein